MDIVIDYADLVGDKLVEIQIKNVNAGYAQVKTVDFLIFVLNIFSPVKFKLFLNHSRN